ALLGCQAPNQRLSRCRLSRTCPADKSHHLATTNMDVDSVKRPHLLFTETEILMDASSRNHRFNTTLMTCNAPSGVLFYKIRRHCSAILSHLTAALGKAAAHYGFLPWRSTGNSP